jgi:hypothetical protein
VIGGTHLEPYLAAGYATLLTLLAMFLQMVARHSHRRTDKYERTGFRYRRHLDTWECPTGHSLTRVHTDFERRIATYRAKAQVCNACHLKANCTESDIGRELRYQQDSWFTSEVCRFQRGISLFLLCLATMVLLLEMTRASSFSSLWLLAAVLLSVGILGIRTATELLSR